jgi:hypothetical protein
MHKFTFALSGFGYWTACKRIPEGMLITIQVLSDSRDAIELACVVDNLSLVKKLDDLEQACHVGEYAILRFVAQYKQFSYCHTGLVEDPNMVQLQGKLVELEGWLRSGELPPAISPEDI